MTWLNLIAVFCAASAWLVTRRAPQHWPVAVALSICAGLDIIRAVLPLPARVDMALCLGAPSASVYLYGVVLDAPSEEPEYRYACLFWWGIWGIAILSVWPVAWWEFPVVFVYGFAVLLGALCVLRLIVKGAPWTATQRTAAMLLAGDVAGVILLCRREWISYQAGAVLALVTGYQVWWLWRSRDGDLR